MSIETALFTVFHIAVISLAFKYLLQGEDK